MKIIFHSHLPDLHSVTIGFSLGLLAGPTIVQNTISTDNYARAVCSVFAMNEYRLLFRGVNNGQDFVQIRFVWPAKPSEGNIEIVEARSMGLSFLGQRAFIVVAEVDDCLDLK